MWFSWSQLTAVIVLMHLVLELCLVESLCPQTSGRGQGVSKSFDTVARNSHPSVPVSRQASDYVQRSE